VHGFDEKEMAEVLGGVLGDEERLRGMREICREVGGRFGWEEVAEGMRVWLK
jgi:hypothetical protein